MRTTIRDIARNLDLSHSTVSKVLNRRQDAFISESTRKRVESEAKRLGYRPNQAARALATGKTGLIGLGIGDFFHSYDVKVMHYVDSYLRDQGYQMLVQRFLEPESAAGLLDLPVDGLLMLDHPEHVTTLLKAAPASLPVVSMGMTSTDLTDHVRTDLSVGAKQAVQHLLGQGYTRILYVTNAFSNRIGEPRFDAYAEGLHGVGLPQEPLIVAAPTRETAYLTFKRFLAGRPFGSRKEKPALFCLNDEIAIGCYRALLENGLRIPEDIGIIGCDNSDDVQYLECPLSSISLSIDPMCHAAVSFLKARLETPTLEKQCAVVTSQFIPRNSTIRG